MPEERTGRTAGPAVAARPVGFGRPGPGGGRGGPRGSIAAMAYAEKPKDLGGIFKRILQYLGRQRRGLIAVLLLVAFSTGLELLAPYLTQIAIDNYIIPKRLGGLAVIALVLLLIYVTDAGVTLLYSFSMIDVAQRTVKSMRNDLFAKVQSLPIRFFDLRPHGELMSRFTNDIENINTTINQSLVQLISSVLTIAGVTVVMLLINWRLAIVCLLSVPIFTLFTRGIARYTLQGFIDQQTNLGTLNGIIEENVTGQKAIKAFVHEQESIAEFGAANLKLKQSAIRAQVFSGFIMPMGNLLNNITFALIVGIGGWMTVKGLATIGVIASFVNYAKQFASPLNQIATLYNTVQSALAGGERVFQVMDEQGEYRDEKEKEIGRVRGQVVLDHVCFSYDQTTPVLKDITLEARPGQTIALVGHTGAGKTTIVNLLARFYDVDSGVISIDGEDIRNLDKDSVRRKLGIVLQDTYLFKGTVRENIRYGRPEATDEEIEIAAVMANSDHFIKHLPEGYDTILSEEGSNLSHGQRQLLSITRTILADPDILVLDEATSSVDTRTEKYIQQAMLTLMQGRTSFIIAHRLSTIREADNILVIDHGEIIERGNHEELLAQKGFYHDLYYSQFARAV
ncbi:MAG: ABC transporter ATP-binding protein [Thermacetogeniaceae bacterium]|jgi:ATP-binding cassette subfamily B protein